MIRSIAANLSLLRRWVVARVRLSLRSPRVLATTFGFPLIIMVVFNALNSGERVAAMGNAGGKVVFAQFYTPSIGIFGLGAACYTGVPFLPLSFVSGIFFPLHGAPGWVVHVAHAFPLFHIVNAFDACLVPQTRGGGWSGHDLAAIAVWGLIAITVATRRLGTEPVTADGRIRRGRRLEPGASA